MPFNLDVWQIKIKQQLPQWKEHWRTGQSSGLVTLYSFVVTMSLLPVVEAIQHNDPGWAALTPFLASAGGNLLANVIQFWKDESTAALQLDDGLKSHPEDHAALDALLEKLDVISQLRLTLEIDERAWFDETLKSELSELGNLARYEGILNGFEAIPPGDDTTAGTGDVVSGNKIKIIGNNNLVGNDNYQDNRMYFQSLPGPDPVSLQRAYLIRMIESTGKLTLSGIDPKAASNMGSLLNLSAVYTGLLTLTSEERKQPKHSESFLERREQRRLSAVEQLDRHSRLVLLGDPGSGKSTFVNFVALCLAGELLQQDPEVDNLPSNLWEGLNLQRLREPLPLDKTVSDSKEQLLQPWSIGALLPIRVVLRDFAARGLPESGKRATAKHLWNFMTAELETGILQDYVPHLEETLRDQGGLLLLDGLDEVPEAEQRREQIKQAVEDFAAVFPKCRILVTSRTYAYQQQAWRLDGFIEAVLAPFGPGQIDRFVERWYMHIGQIRGWNVRDSQSRAKMLKRAIQSSNRLQGLAMWPLLLTLMASLHAWRGGSLPEKREELYADAVELLLDWWEQPKVVREHDRVIVQQPSLAEWLQVDRTKVRSVLEHLAFTAHNAQPELVGTADVPEGDLLSGLLGASRNTTINPAQLIDYLSQRAGLLLPRGVRVYTFSHRTFQEYLAACYLTGNEYPRRLANLVRSAPERWREVALLAGAKSARGSEFALWALVERLCSNWPEVGNQSMEDAWGALIAGQALVESANLGQVDGPDQEKLHRIRAHLVKILEEGRLPAIERAATGRVLAKLGDPRPGVGLNSDGLPNIAWVKIPAGPFLMGSVDEDGQAYNNEKPQQQVELPGYWIMKYPVTQAQYGAFIAAEGYSERRYWTEAGWKWKESERVTGPGQYGDPFDLPTHPVVGVSWYEAMAYCRWLTEVLQAYPGAVPAEWRNQRVEVRLPSESEWEKAARGADGRIYPWGNEPDSARANYTDTGIGTTSAVGCFPGGMSFYGEEESSGNVWEWCATKYEGNYENYLGNNDLEGDSSRVLRGGAFGSKARDVRCAYRYINYPYLRLRYYGFRGRAFPSKSDSEI